MTVAEVVAEIRARAPARVAPPKSGQVLPVGESGGARRSQATDERRPIEDLGLELARELAGGELDALGRGLEQELARQGDERIAELLADEPEDMPTIEVDVTVPVGLAHYKAFSRLIG